MTIDSKTRQAIQHTYHCLLGCGLGEVLGMIIASILGWDKLGRVLLAIALAFFFGYMFTYFGVRKHTKTAKEAAQITLATDTISITSMEIIANIIEFLIPGALMVTIDSPVFWFSLAVSLAIAFVLTVPVNRYMISRNPHTHHQHG